MHAYVRISCTNYSLTLRDPVQRTFNPLSDRFQCAFPQTRCTVNIDPADAPCSEQNLANTAMYKLWLHESQVEVTNIITQLLLPGVGHN